MKANAHFLIVGYSHEHIYKVISKYHPNIIYLISSENLKDSTMSLNEDLIKEGINSECIWINPFNSNTINQIGKEIFLKIEDLKKKYKKIDIFIGFTGGTNLMAIAAGYCAYKLNCIGHYVNKDTEEILEFSKNNGSFPDF